MILVSSNSLLEDSLQSICSGLGENYTSRGFVQDSTKKCTELPRAIRHLSSTVPIRRPGRQLHFDYLESLDRRKSFNFKQGLLTSYLRF